MLIIPFIFDSFESLYLYLKKVYGTRPFSFEISKEDKKNKKYFFVQDADAGQSLGKVRYVYQGPYYKRYIKKIKNAGSGIMMITDRPAAKLVEDLEKNGVYGKSRLIIANGGACVYEYDTNKKRYVLQKDYDKKISGDSATEIQKLLYSLNKKKALGALKLNTKTKEYIVLKDASLFEKLKIILKLKNKNVLDSNDFKSIRDYTRNLRFDIFPEYKLKFSWGKKDVQSKFWNRILKKRYGIVKKQINLPQIRQLFFRRKSTQFDEIKQFDVAKQVLEKLVCYDGDDPHYIEEEVCVTFSSRGLEFLPKDCSKIKALSNWWKNNKDNLGSKSSLRDFMISGDNYNDFFPPVSLKDLREAYKKAKEVNCENFDILEVFQNLSEPKDDELGYSDLAKVGFRYKVKDTSVSSYFMNEKFKKVAEAANDEVIANLKQEQKDKDINEIINTINMRINMCKHKYVNNEITKEDYDKFINELEQEKNEQIAEVDSKIKTPSLPEELKYDGNAHSGKKPYDNEKYFKALSVKEENTKK